MRRKVMKFHIKRAKNRQWYVVLVAANGRVLFTSETYKRFAGCRNLMKAMGSTPISSEILVHR